MTLYTATVRDAQGVRQTVLREAESTADAVAQLRAEGLLVLDVAETGGAGGLPGRLHPAWLLPMSGLDVELGLRQLASMLRSGVSLLQALQTVEQQARVPRAVRAWDTSPGPPPRTPPAPSMPRATSSSMAT